MKAREGCKWVRLDIIEDGGINRYANLMVYLNEDPGSFQPKPWRCRWIYHECYEGTVRAQQEGKGIFPVFLRRVFPKHKSK